MKHYIKVIRPKSWLKNVFVFIPIVFALELFNLNKLLPTLAAFVGFCLISSSVYLFNDICDAKKDAAHPVKKSRPIASGAIPKLKACIYAIFLVCGGLVINFVGVNLLTGILGLAYLALNITYTLYLKHKPIFDCFCIAAGFVLRVYAGATASNGYVSDWLFLTIIVASLFMAFGKRRGELLMSATLENGSVTRRVLQRYDLAFLKGMVFVCAGLSVVFYALWAMYRGNNMVYTVPLIIFMISRYLLNIHNSDSNSQGDPTTVIFDDRAFLLSCGIYAALTVFLLYSTGEAT